jgi:hypothetical protein
MTQTWHEPAVCTLGGGRNVPSVESARGVRARPLPRARRGSQSCRFRMTNVGPRRIPTLPWVSEFPELNVRTYVRVADRPGIYFFSLDAANAMAVLAARTLLNLPYYTASMTMTARAKRDRLSKRARVGTRGVHRKLPSVGPVVSAVGGHARVFPHRALLPLSRGPQRPDPIGWTSTTRGGSCTWPTRRWFRNHDGTV